MQKNLIKKSISALVAIATCAFMALGTVSVSGCLFEEDADSVKTDPKPNPEPEPKTPVLTLGALTGATTMEAGKSLNWTSSLACTNCTGTTTLSTSVDAKEAGLTAAAALVGTTATVTLTAAANLCNDTFTVTLTAQNATLTKSESKKIIVTGDCLMTTDFTLGAQDNSNPSSLDIDEPKDYGASDAKSNSAKIDIIYSWTFTDDEKLASPLWADSNNIKLGTSLVSSWALKNNTKMHAVTKVEYDKVKTKTEIAKLWSNVLGVANSIAIKADDVIIVKTSEGKFALVWVKSLKNSADKIEEKSEIVIQVKK